METDRIVALNPPNISIASFIGSGINGNENSADGA